MNEKQYILRFHAVMNADDENEFKLDMHFVAPLLTHKVIGKRQKAVIYEGVFCGSEVSYKTIMNKYEGQSYNSVALSFMPATAEDVLALMKVIAGQTRVEYHNAPYESDEEITILVMFLNDIEAMELGVPK